MKLGLIVVLDLSVVLFFTATQAWTTDDRGKKDNAQYSLYYIISAEAERHQSARGRTFFTNCEFSVLMDTDHQ